MSRLIAEKRLDKNGNLVTRHVLVATDSTSKETGIPAPVFGIKPSKGPVTKHEYAKEISDFLLEAAGDEDRENATDMLSGNLGIRPLMLIHERMHDTEEWDGELLEMGLARIVRMKDVPSSTRDRHACALVESLPIIKEFGGMHVNDVIATDIASTVAYAAKVNYIKINSPSMTDEDRSILRFFAFEAIVKKTSFSRQRDELVEKSTWFDANRSELSFHAEMIRQRGNTDRELLENFISKDGGHRVLAEGSL